MVLCSSLVLGVDVQVTREDDPVIGEVEKKNYSMILLSALVLGVGVQVTRGDDAVIHAVG